MEEKITLTLENEETKEESIKEESKEVNYENLNEEEKKMVDDFSTQINIDETMQTLQYGSAAQNKVADFSDSILKSIKTKDAGEQTSKLITDLIKEINASNDDSKGFMRIFSSIKSKAKEAKDRYDSVADNVEEIAGALEDHQITLMKDINLLDQLYAKNLTNFKELSMYIIAGKKALEEYKTDKLEKARQKAEKSGLAEDAQKVNDMNEAINRFEKRLHDLELTRIVALQTGPQIRLVQNNNTLMVEKIQSTLVNTIPLWKSQMLISLGIDHSKDAIETENAVNEMTNKMLKQNAENLKMATIDTAKASERGIVDIETLTLTNQRLIETLDEVKKIQEEGRTKRAEAVAELSRIENELKEKLKDINVSVKGA